MQVIATTCYTYSIDFYRAEPSGTSQLFSFIKQEFGMTYAFYVIKLCKKIGYQWAFFLFMFFSILSFLPVAVLMFKGRELREKFGAPRNVNAPDADFEGPVEVDKLGEERKVEEI